MANASHDQLYATMDKKETRKLLEIWRVNDRAAWSEDEFAVVGEILQQRTGSVPQQVIHKKLPDRKSIFADKHLWQGLASLLGAIILFYDASTIHPLLFTQSHRDPRFAFAVGVVTLGFSGIVKLLDWIDVVKQSWHHKRKTDFRKKRRLPPKN